MSVNKEAILNKTHYGLNIYAFVLRQYYPSETVLSLSGRDCQLTKNPFNADRPTLQIKVVDKSAQYSDIEEAMPPGDAFDFAARHFKLEGQALLDKLNKELHLRLDEKKFLFNEIDDFDLPEIPEIASPASPVFSYFSKPVSNVLPTRQVSLTETYALIKGNKFLKRTATLRDIQDVKEARKYKAFNFDYATFSGTFSRRNDKDLIAHSGLLTIDFDALTDVQSLRNELIDDPYFETELLFTSPSGDGVKWIIPVDLTSVSHQEYFKAVANYIKHTYGLDIDGSGRDTSRACFLPHDPDVFINPKYL